MPFLKNLQFTHLIKINGHLKEFNFRKSNANIETVVTVDTSDEQHNRISFNMRHTENEWKIKQDNLPGWILENESCLSDVILKELASQEIYLIAPRPHSHWHLARLLHVFGFN
jgi:hypothetical protein